MPKLSEEFNISWVAEVGDENILACLCCGLMNDGYGEDKCFKKRGKR